MRWLVSQACSTGCIDIADGNSQPVANQSYCSKEVVTCNRYASLLKTHLRCEGIWNVGAAARDHELHEGGGAAGVHAEERRLQHRVRLHAYAAVRNEGAAVNQPDKTAAWQQQRCSPEKGICSIGCACTHILHALSQRW